jgi:hypothetical protein
MMNVKESNWIINEQNKIQIIYLNYLKIKNKWKIWKKQYQLIYEYFSISELFKDQKLPLEFKVSFLF